MEDLEQRIKKIKKKLKDNQDVISRFFDVVNTKLALIFLKSMIDNKLFIEGIAAKLTEFSKAVITLEDLKAQIICIEEIEEIEENEVAESILLGKVCILLENNPVILAVDIEEYPTRVPAEPPSAAVSQGPREGCS